MIPNEEKSKATDARMPMYRISFSHIDMMYTTQRTTPGRIMYPQASLPGTKGCPALNPPSTAQACPFT